MAFPTSPIVDDTYTVGSTKYVYTSFETWRILAVTPIAQKKETEFIATEGQTVFSIEYVEGFIEVYHNGYKLDLSSYTAVDGLTVVLTVPASLNDIIAVVQENDFKVTNTYSKPESDANLLLKESILDNDTKLALKTDLTLISNIDNTSDLSKPISTAQQSAIDLKESITNNDTKLALKESIADNDSKLALKESIVDNDTKLALKAPQSTTYTKDEVDLGIASISTSPTQAQIMAYSN